MMAAAAADENSVIVIDDDDDSDENDAATDHSKPTAEQRAAVESLMAIMNWTDESSARSQLEVFDYSVERTISHLLDRKASQKECKKKPAAATKSSVPTAKRALFATRSDKVAAETKEPKKLKSLPGQELSAQWNACYQRVTALSEADFFVDSDFLPVAASLDGRQRRSEGSTKVVLCKCGIPAAARTVQSDGPNYGRFYLTCGQQQQRRGRRPPVVVVRKDQEDDGDGRKKDESLINPYAKKQASSPSSTTTSKQSPPKSPPQRNKCGFFQWDPDGSMGASGYSTRYSLLAWQHFGLENNCCLYKKAVDPSQVRQGAVGNCWFLSALSVVAEKPYLVHQILPHDSLNDKGCYQINLCLDGKWTPVIVDSNLPVVIEDTLKKKKQMAKTAQNLLRNAVPVDTVSDGSLVAYPAFCAAPDRQLWPALVEKAYAKAHGSYAQLSGGFIAEGLHDLTGAPTETIVFDRGMMEPDELWVRLLSFAQVGFLMGVATARGGDGLVGSHAYSVLDVIEVPDSVIGEQSKVTDYFHLSPEKKKSEDDDDQVVVVERKPPPAVERTTIRLVRIRNPWGCGKRESTGKREWIGDWSADSERWTKALRKRLGSDTFAKGDGTFFMSFEDFIQRFHHLDVAKTREGWIHSSSEGTFVKARDPILSSKYVYRLRPSGRTWAFISIVQPKKRSNTKSKYWYRDPSMLILKRQSASDDWACEACILSGVSRTADCEIFLDPSWGYCCVPFSCLSQKVEAEDFNFRLTTYSAASIGVEQESDDRDCRDAAVRLLHKELLRREHKLLYTVASGGILGCVHGDGCVFFVALNASSEHYLSLKLTIDAPDGVVAVFGLEDDTHDIPPSSQKLLVVISRNGKQSATTQLKFRYMSATVPARRGTCESNRDNHHLGLESSIDLSVAGDLLAASFDDNKVCSAGADTIDTYLWIPQLGSSSS